MTSPATLHHSYLYSNTLYHSMKRSNQWRNHLSQRTQHQPLSILHRLLLFKPILLIPSTTSLHPPLLLSIQHFLFFHTTSFYQHSLFYNHPILIKLLYHHYSTPSILSLLLEYDDITEINLTHSSNTEWILNTLIELHTIYKSLIIVSCR